MHAHRVLLLHKIAPCLPNGRINSHRIREKASKPHLNVVDPWDRVINARDLAPIQIGVNLKTRNRHNHSHKYNSQVSAQVNMLPRARSAVKLRLVIDLAGPLPEDLSPVSLRACLAV
jgi:hypothetical protein